jgi:SAM-dependent methyltransferase
MYGETPLDLWAKIAKAAKITEKDLFLDLGCGRGRLCFWTSQNYQCRSLGVDWVPKFIRRAQFLAWLFRIQNVQFLCTNLKKGLLQEATVIYLYTYHPEEELLDFSYLKAGCRVITVSEPLQCEGFSVGAIVKAQFPWGDTEVFVNESLD